ncbi:MAG: S9 family peptidase [Anaerolinea sp.]|nr:S9 family peptidase [Anaerolinea sp.]
MTRRFETITLADLARFPRPGTVIPGRIEFTPDSKAVTYLFSEEGSLVRSLWRYDIATGERTVLAGPPPASTSEGELSREEELRRERARLRELGVTDYQWAKEAAQPALLVPGGGRLYVSVGGAPLRELEGTQGAIDPRLSEDGRLLAFVRDGELFVVPLSGGQPRRLTDGAEEALTHGLAEFVAQEELDRDRGFWWSPDATQIACIEADSRHIPLYPIVHQGKDEVDIEHHRYPFAGAPNAYVRLAVVDVQSGLTTWMDLGPDRDIYIARVGWRPDGLLTAQLLSRDQRTLRLVSFAVDGTSALLIEERGDPWLNLAGDTDFLKDGSIVWTSERTGFRHISLHDPAGKHLRTLTSGDWVVTSVVDVDEAMRHVYFIATTDGVRERHLYRVSLDGGSVERLTQEPGYHGVVIAPNHGSFVDSWSSLAHPTRVVLRSLGGVAPALLFANEGNSADELGLSTPELIELKANDGTLLQGAVYRPGPIEPGRKYPAIVSVYGGPHVQRIADEWPLTMDLRAQYLAQEGFVVFKLDNRGGANRGLSFEAALADRAGTVEVEDQVAGVRYLSSLGYVDADRIGIYGWSYGGYMTCMAMMRNPEIFKVGVAGAPVTHWDGYDTAYTERYMGTPQSNPEGYFDSAVLSHVAKLQGRLLLVHGMVDENVHFRHTARLITALTEANKDYDLLIFPEERHMPRDAKGMEYQERRVTQYFKDHL